MSWGELLVSAICITGIALVGVSKLWGTCSEPIRIDHAPTERAHGMPLDAEVIEYDRPAWLPDCDVAYKVYDRQTGDSWWLLGCGSDDWIVLPLGEGDGR